MRGGGWWAQDIEFPIFEKRTILFNPNISNLWRGGGIWSNRALASLHIGSHFWFRHSLTLEHSLQSRLPHTGINGKMEVLHQVASCTKLKFKLIENWLWTGFLPQPVWTGCWAPTKGWPPEGTGLLVDPDPDQTGFLNFVSDCYKAIFTTARVVSVKWTN